MADENCRVFRGSSYQAVSGKILPFLRKYSMSLIVQKYGGTSVGTVDRIKDVAQRVAKFKMLGHQVVVVVSAMSGETNRLIDLAKAIQKIRANQIAHGDQS